MNENPDSNQMTKARWEEMCAQHVTLATMIGQLRHEVRLLAAMLQGFATAQGTPIKVEDRTTPRDGELSGIGDYTELLKVVRKGFSEAEPGTESPPAQP